MIQKPKSLTHQHIFAVINTLIHPRQSSSIKILDAGCGDGNLIEFLQNALSVANPNLIIELHGFDVYDHGVQTDGFIIKMIEKLTAIIPDILWIDRIHSVKSDDLWPFNEESFDFIVSNQVLEHVNDKPFFFLNVKNILKQDGYFIALNPLKHCIHEGHIYLPWSHRIKSHATLWKYIKLFSCIGLGQTLNHNKKAYIGRNDYSESQADFIYFWTNYASEKETLDMVKHAGLRGSFSFSLEFYILKLRQIFNIKYLEKYKYNPSNLLDSISIKLLRYLSSVTLVCRKRNIYSPISAKLNTR